jgi:hypothetical protein
MNDEVSLAMTCLEQKNNVLFVTLRVSVYSATKLLSMA